jgi:hypothetical protein
MQEVGRKPLPAFSAFATSLWFSNAGAIAENMKFIFFFALFVVNKSFSVFSWLY